MAQIALNRPAAANTMNLTMTEELADVAARCAFAGVKAVLLTGTGRFFCAGGDLADFSTAPDPGPHIKRVADALHRAMSTFARMDAIVITAVNGVAAGAGMSLAVSGDLVVAARSASFTMAYTGVGLSPDGSASFTLPRLIGLRRTQELMLTNRTLSADEALQWNLVNEVVDDDRLEARATELAATIAGGSAGAQSSVKKLLLATFGSGLEEQMEAEGQLIARNAASTDGIEGVDAFAAKRAARFA
ncbi:enoyl-CoA hydratase/isomerase family protein [Mycobacterium paraseoulense]|uniref:Enoyl-CoA hydratase n=1 Tax=Mycobacterium paraseoulense TaxID=590652 RepID=A0A1X0IF04_9MYCO|nr:enoyl-CoA hydratase/isomerase family protein [Mycobacterium paraseoulense]ORB45486.1 enoyl-CoA hydratase [Mycobacterium paraseoulense]